MGQILIYSEFLNTYKTRGYRINHLKKYEKLFPIESNPLLAGIVADLICDGHLQGNPDDIKTTAIKMYICGASVKKFYDEVGFDGSKQQSLKALLSKRNL